MMSNPFDHLYTAADEFAVVKKSAALAEMLDVLEEHDPDHPVTLYTRALLGRVVHPPPIPTEVRDLWNDLERYYAGDLGIRALEQTLHRTKHWNTD